jgi:hypothetical protein
MNLERDDEFKRDKMLKRSVVDFSRDVMECGTTGWISKSRGIRDLRRRELWRVSD